MKFLTRIRVLYYFIKLCFKPESTQSSIELQRQINNLATDKQKQRYIDKFPYDWSKIKVNSLPTGDMPVGSLGEAMQKFQTEDMNDMTIYKNPKNPFEFITNDMWFGHDVTHILCGFGVDHKGEMGTFSFLCAQYPSPMSIMLVAIGVINTLFHMRDNEERLSSLFKGWDIGKKADSIIGVDWDKHWNEPLDSVRLKLNIRGVI